MYFGDFTRTIQHVNTVFRNVSAQALYENACFPQLSLFVSLEIYKVGLRSASGQLWILTQINGNRSIHKPSM